MNRAAYLLCMLVALICVVLSGVWIWFSHANGGVRLRLQQQQEGLNRGVLSAQGQEISGNILRAMANVAAEDADMRRVLEKHGYRLQQQAPAATPIPVAPPVATNAPGVLVLPESEVAP